MSRRSLAVALFSAILLAIIGFVHPAASAVADDAKPAAKKEPWKPEDFIFSEAVAQYRVSPDGKWLAWSKSSGDKDKDLRISNLYLSSLTGDAHEIALTRGTDNNIQKFLGASPMENRQLYFDASSISYATYAGNKIGVLLVTGTNDDLVDPRQHTEPFSLALKQAGYFVRPVIVNGAPHYWMNDPIDEPTSYSGFLAPRLIRFLAERL